MDTYIGMDFGGTKLLIGELDREGNILRSKSYPTGFQKREPAVSALLAAAADYRATVGFQGRPIAAGIGIVGVVDHDKGEWISINHIADGEPIPLVRLTEQSLGLPAAVDNDVRSATTAELLLGHGRESKNFIYLNVGTGMAAGFVAGGRLLRGSNNNSGEVGHMVVDLNSDAECVCGRRGCAENIVSGMGFTRRVRELSSRFPTRLEIPPEGCRIRAERIFELADEGDPLCAEIASQAARTLACVILNMVRVTDPDTIILGGGVVSDGWLLERVRPLLNPATIRGVRGGIVLSRFQPQNAGLIGAGALAMLRMEEGGEGKPYLPPERKEAT